MTAMQVTVEIHEDNVELLQLLIEERQLDKPRPSNNDIVIPKWQQEMVLARIASSKPESYSDFDEFMKELEQEDRI